MGPILDNVGEKASKLICQIPSCSGCSFLTKYCLPILPRMLFVFLHLSKFCYGGAQDWAWYSPEFHMGGKEQLVH